MRITHAIVLIALARGLAACSGSIGITMPELPKLPSLPAEVPQFPGSSTTVYTRVARGSNSCWFGPNGTLDRTYIWHAKAEPESRGGVAEIVIHERVDKNYRGQKAFSITITPKGDNAAVVVENLKMPEGAGPKMVKDAYRWAEGGVGCNAGDTSWAPVVPEPVKASDPRRPVPKKKPAASTGGAGAATAGQTANVKSTAPKTAE